MNAISQTLIDPVTAPNVSPSGASQLAPDNGVFAGMMAAQTLQSQPGDPSGKSTQIGPEITQGTDPLNAQQPLNVSGSSSFVERFARAIDAPRHDPSTVASLTDSNSPTPESTLGSAVQSLSDGQNPHSVSSFFLRSDGQDVIPQNHVAENKEAVCNLSFTASSQNPEDIATQDPLTNKAATGVVDSMPIPQDGTGIVQAVVPPAAGGTDKVADSSQPVPEQKVPGAAPEAALNKQQAATPLVNSLHEEDSKTSLGTTKETSKKEAATKGVRIANEDVSPAATTVASLYPMTNLQPQNIATDAPRESKPENSVQGSNVVLGLAAVKGKKLVTSTGSGPADITKAEDRSGDAKDSASVTNEASPLSFVTVAQAKGKPEPSGVKQGQQEDITAEENGTQAVTTSIAAKGAPAVRAVHGKAVSGKAKEISADRGNVQNNGDDAAQGTSPFAAAVSSTAPASAPQAATAPHAQPHGSFGLAEATKGTESATGVTEGPRTVQGMDAMATGFSATQPVQMGAEPGSHNQQVEVGFHDSTLGWLSVRAASASENGGLHLSVTGRSTDAAAAVDRMMPSLQHFLQEHDVRAHSVTYGSQPTAAVPFVGGSMASSSFSQNMNDTSANGQRSNSPGNQRSGTESGQQAFSQKDRNHSTRSFSASAGAVYEGAVQNQGLLSIRI